MNKNRINKNKLLDLFYQYLLESNDDRILLRTMNNDKMPVVFFGSHKMEYRFYADQKNDKLIIESFSDKMDNYQTHTQGLNTAASLNIPRVFYEMIESILTKNGYQI